MAAESSRPLYAVLEVAPDASAEDIKRAYRRLALKHHPDRHAASAREQTQLDGDANTTFARLAFAYEVLSEPQRRKRYDLTGELPQSDTAAGRAASETLLKEYIRCAPKTARGVEQADMSLHSLENYEILEVDGRDVPNYMRDIVMIGLGYLASVVKRMEDKEVVLLRHFVMDQMYALLAYDPPLDDDAFKERGYIITYYDHPLQSGIRPSWSDQNGLDGKQSGKAARSELKTIDHATVERRKLAALEWHGAPAQSSSAAPDPEVPGAGQGPERLRLAVRALLWLDPDALASDVHSVRRRLESIMRLRAGALDCEGATSLMSYILGAMEDQEPDEDADGPQDEGCAVAPAAAAGPAVGASVRVLASGRLGEVLVHDPSDSSLTYKVRFGDGQSPEVDWFGAGAVVCAA